MITLSLVIMTITPAETADALAFFTRSLLIAVICYRLFFEVSD